MADALIIKHEGAFIVPERLRKLAFDAHDDRTDQERALRVALQDAVVLANVYRDGRWTECTSGAVNRYVDVDRSAETIGKLRAALKEEALDNWMILLAAQGDGPFSRLRAARIEGLRKEFGLLED